MIRAGIWFLALAVLALGSLTSPAPLAAQNTDFTLSSPAFDNHGPIPLRNSGYGENVSPALSWTGAPSGVQSYALILDDPDAGATPFVHWVIYNIPGTATGLPEGIGADAKVADPAGAVQGPSGLRRTSYFGPRPPAGAPHHYHFKLYALHSPPNLPEGLNAQQLMEAIQPHVIAETVLMGVYQAQ